MPRAYKIFGFLFVTLVGVFGCAKAPTTSASGSTVSAARIDQLEEDYRRAIAARDQFRQKLSAAEELASKTKKELEQQLEQTRAERETLKAEVKTRTGERDAVQGQYENFRKTLRDMLGSADTAMNKLNLQPPAPAVSSLGAVSYTHLTLPTKA